ncbi:MAG: DNA/RNA non-specific endonuclease, partial [Bacteroidales bacterium]|nr:DNA/RNA non-specific endonuclease [Bacteroidales bacterium]
VSIPEYYYKVILVHTVEYQQGLAFFIRNEKATSTDLKTFVISIDSLEEKINVDFCAPLSDSIQQNIENHVDWDAWLFD